MVNTASTKSQKTAQVKGEEGPPQIKEEIARYKAERWRIEEKERGIKSGLLM